MSKTIRLTEGQLRRIIRETQKQNMVKESLGNMFRQIGREFVGKHDSAKKMKRLVDDLLYRHTDPQSLEFNNASHNLIEDLKAHGVSWMRPELGGETLFDHNRLKSIIDAYKKDPAGQYENYESTLRKLKNVLDSYLKGEKV
jgi:hypothetical protein